MALLPTFLSETAEVRSGDWQAARPSPGLQSARSTIVFQAADRRAARAALRSEASIALADMDVNQTGSWRSTVLSHRNIAEAVLSACKESNLESRRPPDGHSGPAFALKVRGLNSFEKELIVDGGLVHASFLDIGLFAHSCAGAMMESGMTPHVHIPGMENRLEARLWRSIMDYVERELELPPNTIRVTAVVDNINAAFEMNEIVFELKDRIVGLSFDRWTYLSSIIRHFGIAADFILGDGADTFRGSRFLDAAESLLVCSAHRRGIQAINATITAPPSSAAGIVSSGVALNLVDGKQRELELGYDGSSVADMSDLALVNRLFRRERVRSASDVKLTSERDTGRAMLSLPSPKITLGGIRQHICRSLRFIAAWLSGGSDSDARKRLLNSAGAEFSLLLLWQWGRCKCITSDGSVIYGDLLGSLIQSELRRILSSVIGVDRIGTYEQAAAVLMGLVDRQEPVPSLAGFLRENVLVQTRVY